MSYFVETATDRTNRRTLVRGALFGLAYGDALAGHPIDTAPQHATAVTQLALFTAEGLLRAYHRAALKGIGGAETQIVWESYLRWRTTQDSHYVPTHYKGSREWPGGWLVAEPVLHRPTRTGPTTWHELSTRPPHPPGRATNQSMGADVLPRVVPVGLLYFSRPGFAAERATELAGLTHGHPAAQSGAAWVAATIAYLRQGQPLARAGRLAAQHLLPGEATDVIRHALETAQLLLENPKHPHLADFWHSMGQRTTPAALLAAYYHAQRYGNQPETALREAASRGGRQAAAITGALLGAQLGEDAWPANWRTTLDLGRQVMDMADDLHTGLKGDMLMPDAGWWQRYPGW